MKRMITEKRLSNIIRESISSVINEKRSLWSQKLYDILQQHGGFKYSQQTFPNDWNLSKAEKHRRRKPLGGNYSNLRDEDIIGVMSREEIAEIQRGHTVDHWRWADNFGLEKHAKERGFDASYNNRVSYDELSDGMYLVYIDRNSGERNPAEEGDWSSYYQKRKEREHNRHADGKNEYKPMSDRSQASQELRRNPYYWNRKGSWKDSENRRRAMNNVRNGQDPSGNPVWRYYNGEAENDKGTYTSQYGR